MNKRMNRKRLNIGTYILQPYARTERHIQRLRECGIDFVVNMSYDKDTLDLFEKYDVGAIVTGILPGWWGGDGDNAGLMAERNPIEKYEKAAEAFADHPAIWGIDTGDEPSALDFAHYGRIMPFVEKAFTNQFAYLNLYPNYASVAVNSSEQTVNQLGTPTYAEHIAKYCENVGLDYICYDFYMYSASVNGAYENLRIVSEAALHSGRDMWIVLQVNSSRENEWISLDKLRFQAFSAMAFGAKNIIWACYTAGWWHNQVIDESGEETEQYGKLKAVNAEISALSDIYSEFHRVNTHFIGFSGKINGVNITPVKALDTGTFYNVRACHGQSLLVGQFVSDDGRQALFVCAADDPSGAVIKDFYVKFSAPYKKISAYGVNGEAEVEYKNKEYRVKISSCKGVMIIAE